MKKMKVLLGLILAGSLLHGCGSGDLEFGFGGIATFAADTVKVAEVTEVDGEEVTELVDIPVVQTEINYVSLTLNKKGVIQDLRLDTVQIKVGHVDGENVLLDSGVNEIEVLTKWELLEDYGMKGLSTAIGIGKEWYEQAESFEKWTVGKTVSEVKAKVKDDHYLDGGVDVGVSIHVDGFVNALEVAAANTVKVKGKVAAIGVGGVNRIGANGTGFDFTIGGAAFDNEQRVLGARIDTFQLEFVQDAEKTIMDSSKVQIGDGVIRGKQELKDEYGMKHFPHGNGKEWYEQAQLLVNHLVGKKIYDALGPDEKLANGVEVGVTMNIDAYRHALTRANHSAFQGRY